MVALAIVAATPVVLAAVVAALIGISRAGVALRMRRRPPPPVAGPWWPCDYIDKGGLAISDRAHGCSGTPTWRLVVRGALEAEHVRRALADVVARYPSLATKVQPLDGAPLDATRFRYAHDPAFSVEQILEAIDLRGDPAALPVLAQALQNRHLDLFADAPMTLTLVRSADDACILFFRQHHAIADGRAFIALLADFATFLDAARAGRRPPAEALAPVGRRSELDALALPRWRRALDTLAGYGWLLRAGMRASSRPVVPLVQNRSNDYRGDNGTVHWSVDDAQLARWNAARKRIGCSLNSLFTAALFAANQRWHRALGEPLGRTAGTLVMETRPRDPTFVSFANHLATLEVEAQLGRDVDLGSEAELATLARNLQAQVDRQRRVRVPIKRLLCERQLARGMKLAAMQRFVFESKRATYNFNFSNLVALEFPAIGGDGWSVDEVLITTPVTPRAGIVVTVIRYRERVVFNVNYKSSAATRAEAEALLGHLQTILGL
jgi:hypothetical protein